MLGVNRIVLRVVFVLLLIGAVSGCQTQVVAHDWPETITYARLDLSDKDALSQQTYALPTQALSERLGDPKQTLTREYSGIKGPTGHGLFGTTVYYVVNDNQFYFHSDCGQGHNDGYIGPFDGDPRIILDPALDKADTPPVERDSFVGEYTAFK